jgi:hypothetical protein
VTPVILVNRARLVVVTALAAALGSVVTGCAGGGALEATLEAPPVEISASDARKELRFRAEARTSSPVLDGSVSVVVDPAYAEGDGQVRVTVYRGPDAVADPAPTGDVVPCAAEAPVEVPRPALSSCEGNGDVCSERFVVVFAAEGLADAPVEMPVLVQAQLVYEHATDAPDGDVLVLTLE